MFIAAITARNTWDGYEKTWHEKLCVSFNFLLFDLSDFKVNPERPLWNVFGFDRYSSWSSVSSS